MVKILFRDLALLLSKQKSSRPNLSRRFYATLSLLQFGHQKPEYSIIYPLNSGLNPSATTPSHQVISWFSILLVWRFLLFAGICLTEQFLLTDIKLTTTTGCCLLLHIRITKFKSLKLKDVVRRINLKL